MQRGVANRSGERVTGLGRSRASALQRALFGQTTLSRRRASYSCAMSMRCSSEAPAASLQPPSFVTAARETAAELRQRRRVRLARASAPGKPSQATVQRAAAPPDSGRQQPPPPTRQVPAHSDPHASRASLEGMRLQAFFPPHLRRRPMRSACSLGGGRRGDAFRWDRAPCSGRAPREARESAERATWPGTDACLEAAPLLVPEEGCHSGLLHGLSFALCCRRRRANQATKVPAQGSQASAKRSTGVL